MPKFQTLEKKKTIKNICKVSGMAYSIWNYIIFINVVIKYKYLKIQHHMRKNKILTKKRF